MSQQKLQTERRERCWAAGWQWVTVHLAFAWPHCNSPSPDDDEPHSCPPLQWREKQFSSITGTGLLSLSCLSPQQESFCMSFQCAVRSRTTLNHSNCWCPQRENRSLSISLTTPKSSDRCWKCSIAYFTTAVWFYCFALGTAVLILGPRLHDVMEHVCIWVWIQCNYIRRWAYQVWCQ